MPEDKEIIFGTEVSALPFLGANSTTEKGEILFPSVGKKICLEVVNWSWFTDVNSGKQKPSLELKTETGENYSRVVGANMAKTIAKFGYSHPDDLIGLFITFEKYDTKSQSPKFRWGLRIIAISENKTLE